MNKFKLIVLSVAVLTFASVGKAEKGQGHIGALAGLGFASGTSAFTFGADGVYKVMPEFGIGLLGTYNSVTGGSTINALAEFNYYFQGSIKGLYLGALAGMSFTSPSSSFAFAPAAGYDFLLGDNFSLGLMSDFLIFTAAGSTSLFQAFGTIRYQF